MLLSCPVFFASGFHQALAFAPIVSGELRAYIAHARSFQPHVPVELSNYIASAYAEMRQDEIDAGEKATVRS